MRVTLSVVAPHFVVISVDEPMPHVPERIEVMPGATRPFVTAPAGHDFSGRTGTPARPRRSSPPPAAPSPARSTR